MDILDAIKYEGKVGIFFEQREVAFLSPSKIISTLKCTVCSSEVATVQDAPRDQHGIHLNFGPLFARHFIERTCSLRAKNEKLKYDCYFIII